MRYGLLADIHEEVTFLRLAIDELNRRGVDRLVMLGDVFETGVNLAETVQILRDADAQGVWGNHDFGLCRDPHPSTRERFGAELLGYFERLTPSLICEDVLFTHMEPWKNAEDLMDLWSFGTNDIPRSFVDCSHRLMVHGHHHRWKVSQPQGPCPWDCLRPLDLDPAGRYLIEVGAVMDGRCGILDTSRNQLIPIDLRDPYEIPSESGRMP